MFAIKRKRDGKWVSGTDYRQSYGQRAGIGELKDLTFTIYKQLCNGDALTFYEYENAEFQFNRRGCSTNDYVIVPVKVVEA